MKNDDVVMWIALTGLLLAAMTLFGFFEIEKSDAEKQVMEAWHSKDKAQRDYDREMSARELYKTTHFIYKGAVVKNTRAIKELLVRIDALERQSFAENGATNVLQGTIANLESERKKLVNQFVKHMDSVIIRGARPSSTHSFSTVRALRDTLAVKKHILDSVNIDFVQIEERCD